MIGRDHEAPAPRHPRIDRRSLVLWSDVRARLDPALLPRDAVGAIALPLRDAAVGADAQALRGAGGGALPLRGAGAGALPLPGAGVVTQARAAGLGVALAGEARLNQLPPEQRPRGFAALPYAQPRALELESGRLGATAAADYAELFLDAQLAAGATLATTPAHVFEHELGRGREHDLALAAATITAWQERQGWRPPPQRADDPPRELHAALAVRAGALEDAVEGLIERYAALEVDGYVVMAIGLGEPGAGDARAGGAAGASGAAGAAGASGAAGESGAAGAAGASSAGAEGTARREAVQLAALTELALGLQAASGRPVTVAGAGALQPALLASGVAAICGGPFGERASFPPRAADGEGVSTLAVEVFHPAIVGPVPLGAEFDETRTWLFAAHPCRCGEHPAYEPPGGRRQTLRHNAWCLATEARDATRLVPVMDEARLAARIQRADSLRRRLGLEPLGPAWPAVAHAARAHRGRGHDASVGDDALGLGA